MLESYQIVQCGGCKTLSFFHRIADLTPDYFDPTEGVGEFGDFDVGDPDSWQRYFRSWDRDRYVDVPGELFPARLPGRTIIRNRNLLPDRIGDIYREVHLALLHNQPVLAGIGVRALIESVCKDLGSPGKILKDQIEGLLAAGKLTVDGAKILHQLRDQGNKAAHEGASLTERRLLLAMDAVEHLLLGTYILPRELGVVDSSDSREGS